MNHIIAIECTLLLLVFPRSLCRAEADVLVWRNAGPGGGGWIQSVAMDPADANTIHVGSDIGGYYQSTDGGRTFQIFNDGLSDYFIERIVVDPMNNEIIYLGTQSGVFKSVNGGRDWRQKRNGFPPAKMFHYSAPIGALVMDPKDRHTLYAGIGRPRLMTAGRGHLYKTVDGAESWDLLDGIATYASDAVIHQLAIVRDNSQTLYAATDRGLFKSADGGLTWERKEAGLPHRYCRNVAIHPLQSNRMYAVMWSPPGQTPWQGGIYRSDDAGQSWTAKSHGLPQHVGSQAEAAENTSNYLALVLDPCDPESLYVGSTSWWGTGLYRSTNGGDRWELCTRETQNGNLDKGWISFWGMAVQCASISTQRPETLVFGDVGRLMRTDDAGDSWRQIYAEALPDGSWRGNGLEVTYLPEITVDPFDPNRLYGGYADIGLMVSDNAGDSWRPLSNGLPMRGDVARVACDPQRQGVAWCCMGRTGQNIGGVAMTLNGGETWEVIGSVSTGLPSDAASLITIDPDSPTDSRRLYVSSDGNGLYRSEDGGRTWGPISNGLGSGPLHITDLVMDPGDSSRLFAARRWDDESLQGGLYLTQDRGATWRKANANTELPDIQSIALHPENASIVLVGCREYYSSELGRTFAGGLYQTRDRGRTWKHVLDDPFVSCVRFSPHDPDLVYAGTTDHPYHDDAIGDGILISRDGGDTWAMANEGLSNRCIVAITLDHTDPNRVYVGTGGNGFFIGDWVTSEDSQ